MNNMPDFKICLVTGANGYIGSKIKTALSAQGYRVLSLVREPKGPEEIAFRLGGEVPKLPEALALIHCAYDFMPLSWPDVQRVNVQGSIELFEAAKKAGVQKSIFISSMSAFDGCQSFYGKSKLEVEQAVINLNGVVVRPGMVYGDNSGGMVGKLSKLVSKLKVIPLVGGGQELFLSHEDDLVALISLLVSRDFSNFPNLITAANSEALTFSGVLHELAERLGRSPIIISTPWKPLLFVLRTLESFGMRLGFKSDSLVSLMNTNPAPTFTSLEDFGIKFRPFSGPTS